MPIITNPQANDPQNDPSHSKLHRDEVDAINALEGGIAKKFTKDIAGEIEDLTEKTTLHNDDLILIEDSEDIYNKKKVKKSNLSNNLSKASGSDIDTGTDDDNYVTSKSIADSKVSFTDGTETLTNKTIDLDDNTILNAGKILVGENLLDNSNFINVSTYGYGTYASDDWGFPYNSCQGGFPTCTAQELIDNLGIDASNIKGLWNLNNSWLDLSGNNNTLTPSNSPTFTKNYLMEYAANFSLNNMFATVSSSSCRIAGSQTFACNIFLGTLPNVITKFFYVASNDIGLGLDATNHPTFEATGLTPNIVTSPVTLKIGVSYHIVGGYDAANNLLFIEVNGIRTTATVTGTLTAPIDNLVIGGDSAHSLQGFMQNPILLNIALSESSCKKLWYMHGYRGMKLGTHTHSIDGQAYINQIFSDKQKNEIQGKTVTLVAKTLSTGTNPFGIHITLDNVSKYSVTITPVANVWETHSLTVTIPNKMSYANFQYCGFSKFSPDTIFIDWSMLYEGETPVAFWNASANDWVRFPRLMRMDPPADLNGGYHFEEDRWYHYPVIDSGAINPTVNLANYLFSGKKAEYQIVDYSATSNDTVHNLTLPFKSADYWFIGQPGNIITSQGTNALAYTTLGSNYYILRVYKDLQLNPWANSGDISLHGAISVAID